jgi:predicted dinucleotide-binding enzyme
MALSSAAVEANETGAQSPATARVGGGRLGIVGVGKLGTALARTALAAGYDVAIAGSGPADQISLQVDVLAPGAVPMTVGGVVDFADVVVLAVPTHRFRELPADLFDGKVLVDAMNYWPDTDGDDAELAGAPGGSSSIVQAHFPGARVVKSLNQLGYHELDEYPRESRAPDRIAVGAAGDDRLAVHTVMRLIDDLGFDPVDAGDIARGQLLEPDGSPYAVTYTAAELTNRLSSAPPGSADVATPPTSS